MGYIAKDEEGLDQSKYLIVFKAVLPVKQQ